MISRWTLQNIIKKDFCILAYHECADCEPSLSFCRKVGMLFSACLGIFTFVFRVASLGLSVKIFPLDCVFSGLKHTKKVKAQLCSCCIRIAEKQ